MIQCAQRTYHLHVVLIIINEYYIFFIHLKHHYSTCFYFHYDVWSHKLIGESRRRTKELCTHISSSSCMLSWFFFHHLTLFHAKPLQKIASMGFHSLNSSNNITCEKSVKQQREGKKWVFFSCSILQMLVCKVLKAIIHVVYFYMYAYLSQSHGVDFLTWFFLLEKSQ